MEFHYNLLLAVDASDEICPKAHVFATEETVFEADDDPRPIDVDADRVTPLVCFDVEFPETAVTLAVLPPVDCMRSPDVKEWR